MMRQKKDYFFVVSTNFSSANLMKSLKERRSFSASASRLFFKAESTRRVIRVSLFSVLMSQTYNVLHCHAIAATVFNSMLGIRVIKKAAIKAAV